jgi:CRISPR-associated endonuclease Cas1
MAASATVSQPALPRNFFTPSDGISWTELKPRFGVLTLSGYGIRVAVDRGHLTVQDGIGLSRRSARFSKIEDSLRRIVVVGVDGFVSLAAFRWLADRDAAFVMLDRRGTVIAVSGPVRPSDARLRRAQALAHTSGVALDVACELIRHKLLGQEEVARHRFQAENAADQIGAICEQAVNAKSIEAVRSFEASGAQIYWTAWRNLEVRFPQKDTHRLPAHWLTFGARKSPLTGSPRVAVNPANAMLNYLYALLEAESRLALSAMGLDPGLGVLHADTPARDSLACDLMEAARPLVDAYVFDWITSEPFRREWFFEARSGNCRLMSDFTERLTHTASMWARAVAPHAEMIARQFWSRRKRSSAQEQIPTRLTQTRKRDAREQVREPLSPEQPKPTRICRHCGADLKRGRSHCSKCSPAIARDNLLIAAELGRIKTHAPAAEARRGATQAKQRMALRNWNAASHPEWLSEHVFRTRIRPLLAQIEVPTLAKSIDVSKPYATSIRRGERLPHPRHWLTLASLVGLKTP